MKRDYQYHFSSAPAGNYDADGRRRKAMTMIAVLTDYFPSGLGDKQLLNVGGSSGYIDEYLAEFMHSVISVDIDEKAIEQAQSHFKKTNLEFQIGDAMKLAFEDNRFDIVICSQVYEHVPSAEKMMAEILRVLAPGGICYFAASNRFMWNEPHYNLPLLSVIPRPLAHVYIRAMKKADYYHELHYSYWGLKKLVNRFRVHDYTVKIIDHPRRFQVTYMLPSGSFKAKIASFIAHWMYWLSPGYIWLLEKPPRLEPIET